MCPVSQRFSLVFSNYLSRYVVIVITAILLSPSIAPTTVFAKSKPKPVILVEDGQPIDLRQEKYKELFRELEREHQFRPDELERLFKGQTISKRVLELMDKQRKPRPYYTYSTLFLTPKTVLTGRIKLRLYRELLDRIEKEFGVNREIIVAIWAIETRYGGNQGYFNIMQTLNTLFDAYPKRSAFFRKELIQFLLVCRESGVDPQTAKGSYAGAFGQAQFMPSSYRKYAVSFDGDDYCDIWHSVPDALASIANYIRGHGWMLDAPVYAELGHELKDRRLAEAVTTGRKGRVPWELVRQVQNGLIPPSPRGQPLSVIALELNPKKSTHAFRYVAGYPNFHTITEYNHSNFYGMTTSELADAFATDL